MNTKTLLYIFKRIMLALLTVWVVITITFFVTRLVPGGPFMGEKAISQAAMDALVFAWENEKFVAAICAGPTVLADLGITDNKNATCYPGCEAKMGSAKITEAAAVRDGLVITGTSAGCAISFGLALIEALKGKEIADTVAKQIVIR